MNRLLSLATVFLFGAASGYLLNSALRDNQGGVAGPRSPTASGTSAASGHSSVTIPSGARRVEDRPLEAKLRRAEMERDEALTKLENLDDEFLLRFGTIEATGSRIGAAVRTILESEARPESAPAQEEAAAVLEDVLSFSALNKAIEALDADPTEAARYQSRFLQALLGLSDHTVERIRAILEETYRDTAKRGINLASKPEEHTGQWYEARRAYYDQINADIRAVLAAEEVATLELLEAGDLNLVDPFQLNLFELNGP